MAEARNSLHLVQLRARLHFATNTLALQAALKATKRKLSAQGLKVSHFPQRNYHFKSKDGLYFEVLKTAFEKLTTDAGFDPEKLKTLSREQALRSFLRQQLRPLLLRDEMSRYIRLFAWEAHTRTQGIHPKTAKNSSQHRTPR